MSERDAQGISACWYAIKTRREFKAAEQLSLTCAEVFLPTRQQPSAPGREQPVIPHVLFVKSQPGALLELERTGREHPEQTVPFWIYRYPSDSRIREIPPRQIDLLRLLTSPDTTGCEIYSRTDFRASDHVRITGGLYAGLDGYVQRVKKNKHVIVRLEGICAVLLPFIHPDLLEKIEE